MDVADFESWLGRIASLTFPQRRRTWQALALLEASDSHVDEADVSQDLMTARIDLMSAGERSVAMVLPAALASSPIAGCRATDLAAWRYNLQSGPRGTSVASAGPAVRSGGGRVDHPERPGCDSRTPHFRDRLNPDQIDQFILG
jgi:hypothetical protein